jgi:hypothetical protein
MLSAYAEIATRPAIVAVELVGLALLGWVVAKGQLHRKEGLKRLVLTGKILAGRKKAAAGPLPPKHRSERCA